MQAAEECRGEPACVRDEHERSTSRVADAGEAPGTRNDIPVRRYGTVPLLDEEPGWEIESRRPRTIADFGGTAVLLAALGTAALAGLLLYVY